MDCRLYEPLRRACRAIETDIKTLFMPPTTEGFLFRLFKISIISIPLLFPVLRETSAFRYILAFLRSELKYIAPIPSIPLSATSYFLHGTRKQASTIRQQS